MILNRDQQPAFWRAVMADVVSLGWIAGAFLFFIDRHAAGWAVIESVVPLTTFGACFAAATVLLLVGVWRSALLFRLGLIVGTMGATMLSVGTLLAASQQLADHGSAGGAAAPAAYGFFAYSLFLQVATPRGGEQGEDAR